VRRDSPLVPAKHVPYVRRSLSIDPYRSQVLWRGERVIWLKISCHIGAGKLKGIPHDACLLFELSGRGHLPLSVAWKHREPRAGGGTVRKPPDELHAKPYSRAIHR